MSENKKVIHVKNLEIHAENVEIIPPRRRDPFFGPRREEIEATGEEEVRETPEENVQEEEDNEREDDQQRPPFSWI
ncbi:hypothetical protein GGQ92_001362 [Gracilibacillus halotolerans]|uniref:Uncharacterized protein n=1 Tax=Gracilibacillus halotolerans TaxID=74386 RepID=A0A841RM91_9BACI|nr:hypothetical protein [Gracilibacillus halotolerans]MBB6512576.1 hypothetical protein [Gracilibacillus halotolerans]